eukprot:TRINITY_DN29555_c0_g2_i1.p1 TRINITY_DN29555_c0_g2~~TRINITY_DN29555_c0_g2_i1.p1  ORF type:complete len:1064 (+),score=296.53 TRINITY_DN29555_c0_g2_i1:81-3194(+)
MDARDALKVRIESVVMAKVEFHSYGVINGELKYLVLCARSLYLVDPTLTEDPEQYHYAWIKGIKIDSSNPCLFWIEVTERPSLFVDVSDRKELVNELLILWKSDFMMRHGKVGEIEIEQTRLENRHRNDSKVFAICKPPSKDMILFHAGEYRFFASKDFRVSGITTGGPSFQSKQKRLDVNVFRHGMTELGVASLDDMSVVRLLCEKSAHREVVHDASEAEGRGLQDFLIEYSGSYRKKQNLDGDLASWFCWEMEVFSQEWRTSIIRARRKHVPAIPTKYHDVVFLLREPAEKSENFFSRAGIILKYELPDDLDWNVSDKLSLWQGWVNEGIRETYMGSFEIDEFEVSDHDGRGDSISTSSSSGKRSEHRKSYLVLTTHKVVLVDEDKCTIVRYFPFERISSLCHASSDVDALWFGLCIGKSYDIFGMFKSESACDIFIKSFMELVACIVNAEMPVKEISNPALFMQSRTEGAPNKSRILSTKREIGDDGQSGSRKAKSVNLKQLEKLFDSTFTVSQNFNYDRMFICSMLEALQCDREMFDWCESTFRERPLLFPRQEGVNLGFDVGHDRAAIFFKSIVNLMEKAGGKCSVEMLDPELELVDDPFEVIGDLKVNVDSPALIKTKDVAKRDMEWESSLARYLAYCVDGGHGTFTTLEEMVGCYMQAKKKGVREPYFEEIAGKLKSVLNWMFHLKLRDSRYKGDDIRDMISQTGFLTTPFVFNDIAFDSLLKSGYLESELGNSALLQFLLAILQQGRRYRCVIQILEKLSEFVENPEIRREMLRLDAMRSILPYLNANDQQIDFHVLNLAKGLSESSGSARKQLMERGYVLKIAECLFSGNIGIMGLAMSLLEICLTSSDLRQRSRDLGVISKLAQFIEPTRVRKRIHRVSNLISAAIDVMIVVANDPSFAQELTRQHVIENFIGWLDTKDSYLLERIAVCMYHLGKSSKSIRRYIASQRNIVEELGRSMRRTADPFTVRELLRVLAMLSANVTIVGDVTRLLKGDLLKFVHHVCGESDDRMLQYERVLLTHVSSDSEE